MGFNYLASLSHYVPELLACFTMFTLVLFEATFKTNTKRTAPFYIVATLGLVAVLMALFKTLHSDSINIFTNSISIDPFSTFLKIVMVFGTILSIYVSHVSNDIGKDQKGEFAILVTGVLVGAMLLASANNMLILYIGIETLSILSYALASLQKNDDRSTEAGLKYSLYGAMSSGIMLFGLSIVFGVFGTINFSEIATQISTISTTQVAVLVPSFLLVLAGLGYKIACVPFHMWSPDVYEGSPIPVTSFFAVVPKFAGVAAIVRITFLFFHDTSVLSVSWVGILSVIAVLTMTVGNVSAIGQRSVKRMLAYSSISHAGVILLGVIVVDKIGLDAILFYSVAYVFMNMLAFFITTLIQNNFGNDHFERFSGLIKKYPLIAILMTVTMLSLAGIPPFAGFIAKFNILAALVSKKLYTLAIIAVVNSVVSVYYYMKVVRLMIFNKPESEEPLKDFTLINQGLCLAMTLPIVLLGIYWSSIINLIEHTSILFK